MQAQALPFLGYETRNQEDGRNVPLLCRERPRSRGLRTDRTSSLTAVRLNGFFSYNSDALEGNTRLPCALLAQVFVTLRSIVNRADLSRMEDSVFFRTKL